jgi:hypothetical protein
VPFAEGWIETTPDVSRFGEQMLRAHVVALVIAASAAFAQPQWQPTPNDTLKSPEVLPDLRVVFRIYAPKASAVTLTGDFVPQGRGTGRSARQGRPGHLVDHGWPARAGLL